MLCQAVPVLSRCCFFLETPRLRHLKEWDMRTPQNYDLYIINRNYTRDFVRVLAPSPSFSVKIPVAIEGILVALTGHLDIRVLRN